MTFSISRRTTIFDVIIYITLFLFAFICVAPFIYVLSVSFTSPDTYVPYQFYLVPKKFSLASYRYLLNADSFMNALKNSVFITIVGTIMALFITFSFAYGISKQDLPGRKFINVFLIITLLLNAGIIPNYILIRNLNLINSLWAVILTMLTSAWNVIVVRSFLMSLPHELEEAAMIDGYNDIQTFFNIIIPLSLPCLASFLLIFAVQYWNVYFNSMLYISNPKKWTLQVLVKTLIVDASSDAAGMMSGDEKMMPQETIRYAAVMLSIFPILLVYPYLQKYFISGITLGAIKG